MNWYNYLAATVDTPLDRNAIVTSQELETRLSALGAGSMYHCYYDLEQRETFVGYEGLMKPVFNSIYIDLDDDETKGEQAWVDSKNLCTLLRENNVDFTLYFSGNKGFHICINMQALGINPDGTPKPELENFIKSFLFGLKETYKTVDNRIWNANRKFRAAGSRHEKSGLYKTLLYPGRKVSNLTMSDIRELAKTQGNKAMVHPTYSGDPSNLLLSFVDLGKTVVGNTTFTGKKAQQKEIPQGLIEEDDSAAFRLWKDKKCIQSLSDSPLPSSVANRHDQGLRIMSDLYMTGSSLEDAEKKMNVWASKVYGSDTARISDTIRMVHDTYSKPQDYRFGCYDDIRMKVCSAKCKVYTKLDPKRRAKPLDVTKTQSQENQVQENPNLELSEGELADLILKNFGKEIIKADQDFFFWEGTHWNRMDRDRAHAAFYTLASAAYQNQAHFAKIESLVRQIKIKIPVAPENNHFYTSSPNLFNFTDGTVIVTKSPDGQMKLTLRPHDKTDLLGYCAPFPFESENKLPRNGQTEKYFDSRLVDLGAEGVRMMKQMLGAALIPYKPWIFFLVGDSDSGKSTMALMIKSLLGERNVSGVEPVKSGNNFLWESAIGKIANIATELPKDAPLDVNTLKKIRDKTPQFINRKGVKAVEATLPFLHIYCANILPASFEGNTGALDNRMTVIKFKKVYVNGLADIDNLGQWLWDQDAASILDYAREGLADLVASGFKYYRSDVSRNSLTEWQDETDPVKTFVKEVEAGEYRFSAEIFVHSGVKLIKALDIFTGFKAWAEESKYKAMGKIRFFKELERCGVVRPPRANEGNGFLWAKALEKGSVSGLISRPVDREPAIVSARF